jgi:hypothetical protein
LVLFFLGVVQYEFLVESWNSFYLLRRRLSFALIISEEGGEFKIELLRWHPVSLGVSDCPNELLGSGGYFRGVVLQQVLGHLLLIESLNNLESLLIILLVV